MEVRDYECDIEGIVNNANYLHYMEHTRHLFLKECGLSFAEMHNKGVDAVVARMNLQYKVPLQCDDEFFSRLWLEKQGVRYVFHQDIFRAKDEKLCLKATVELVCPISSWRGTTRRCRWGKWTFYIWLPYRPFLYSRPQAPYPA